MVHRRFPFAPALLLALALLVSPLLAGRGHVAVAQEDGPAIAVADLTNPRGFTWAPDGAMMIAEAGTG